MPVIYVLAGVTALCLLAYLFVALFEAERFS